MAEWERPVIDGLMLRELRPGETECLAEIDHLADQMFLESGIPNIAAIATGPLTPLDEFQAMIADCSVYVACIHDGLPVGFVCVQPIGGETYIRLLAVNPEFGRRGIGTALLYRALEHGRQNQAIRCVLSTFRDVSFNEPYYRRHGFSELPMQIASNVQRRMFDAEVPQGIDPAQRLLMVREL